MSLNGQIAPGRLATTGREEVVVRDRRHFVYFESATSSRRVWVLDEEGHVKLVDRSEVVPLPPATKAEVK